MLKRVKVPGSLIASDLPPATKEEHLQEIFMDYGPLLKLELHCDEILSFARISFECVEDAFSAMEDLEDLELFGERIRLIWSTPFDVVSLYQPESPSQISLLSADDLQPPPVHVLFSYISSQVVERISESIIAESFAPFGVLIGVSIKKHNTIVDGGYQNGFGFVEFSHNWPGISSAIRAVKWFDKKYMGHMTIDAKFGQQFQKFLVKNMILTEAEISKMKDPANANNIPSMGQFPKTHSVGQQTRMPNTRIAVHDDRLRLMGPNEPRTMPHMPIDSRINVGAYGKGVPPTHVNTRLDPRSSISPLWVDEQVYDGYGASNRIDPRLNPRADPRLDPRRDPRMDHRLDSRLNARFDPRLGDSYNEHILSHVGSIPDYNHTDGNYGTRGREHFQPEVFGRGIPNNRRPRENIHQYSLTHDISYQEFPPNYGR